MIGDDPYTLGLFDTAGSSPPRLYIECQFSDPRYVNRSGRLRSLASAFIPANGRFPGLLQRYLPRLVREREGEMVPRSSASLSRSTLPRRWDTGGSEGRPTGH